MDRLVLTLQENLLGIRVVKGFANESQQKEKFDGDNAAVRKQKHWIFWRITTLVPVVQVLAIANIMVLLGYGGYLVINEPSFPVDQGGKALPWIIGNLHAGIDVRRSRNPASPSTTWACSTSTAKASRRARMKPSGG